MLKAKRKWLGDNSRENKINPLIPTMNKDHFSWQIYGAGTYTVYLPSTMTVWYCKVHIFWEGHKILQNLHRRFDWHCIGQIYGADFVALSEYMNFITMYIMKVVNSKNANKKHENSLDLKIFGSNECQRIKRFDISNLTPQPRIPNLL